MKKFVFYIVLVFCLSACSTAGNMYKKGDITDGDFSIGKTVLSVLAVAATVAVAVAAGQRGGGSATATDYDWAWDQYYNEYRQLVWACRGKQTGQFAEKSRCSYKLVNDSTWPSN